MERTVYTYSKLVKILILTKGAETEFKKNVRKADCRNISYMSEIWYNLHKCGIIIEGFRTAVNIYEFYYAYHQYSD